MLYIYNIDFGVEKENKKPLYIDILRDMMFLIAFILVFSDQIDEIKSPHAPGFDCSFVYSYGSYAMLEKCHVNIM